MTLTQRESRKLSRMIDEAEQNHFNLGHRASCRATMIQFHCGWTYRDRNVTGLQIQRPSNWGEKIYLLLYSTEIELGGFSRQTNDMTVTVNYPQTLNLLKPSFIGYLHLTTLFCFQLVWPFFLFWNKLPSHLSHLVVFTFLKQNINKY